MVRGIFLFLILLAVCLAVPALAQQQGGGSQGSQGPQGGGSRGAPEPVTLLGLGLGAAAVGGAAWRVSRKR